MSTSQNTWGSPSVIGVKGANGGSQETGGTANPTPNVVSGSWDGVSVKKVDTVGWASPLGEASKENKNCM